MKRFRGKIKTITPSFPYTVTMQNGKTFVSEFQFKAGWLIDLSFEGDIFTYPWPSGFVLTEPNGFSEYQLTNEKVLAAKNPKSSHWEHNLPPNVRLAVTSGIPVKWTMVESFYKHHYTATFNPQTNILRTNWAMTI